MVQVSVDRLPVEATIADFFAVLSSPIRLAVLRLLEEGERSVTELVDALSIAQPRVSNHLACLRTCGLVTVRRQGTFQSYALADHRLADVLQLGGILAGPSETALARCAVLRRDKSVQRETSNES